VKGAERISDQSESRFIIVGERHGTAETPALFGDLACLASASGPLIVGLEMEADHQTALDAFLSSDGSDAAKAAWRSRKHWQLRDGRGSIAMWGMIDRLRQLREGGRDISALAFMLPAASPEARERALADAWQAPLAKRKDARLLALVGSVHAETEAVGTFQPAASFLPPESRLTLSYVPWEAMRCGAVACVSITRSGPAQILSAAPAEWRWPRYDAFYTVGRRFTASPPVHPDARR
jgi:hypothetical protein